MSGSRSSHGDQAGHSWKSLTRAWTRAGSAAIVAEREISNSLMAASCSRNTLRGRHGREPASRVAPPPSLAPVSLVTWRDYDAVLFDLDGVITPTAEVHMRAWSDLFTAFLEKYAAAHAGSGADLSPYTEQDYFDHVDGKPRYDGVRDFLASRGIELPEGASDDPASAETVHGLGNRKNDLVQEIVRRDGVEPYAGSIRYVEAARDAGLRTAVVSASANTQEILRAAGIAGLFDDVVDGHAVEDRGLKGKPAPDTFLAAAHDLGVEPAHAAVYED